MSVITQTIDTIPWARPFLVGSEKKYVLDALASTWISSGPYVDRFEREFASTCRVPFCLTTSSGTTALQLALLALRIGPGDEVIVPGYTFVAPVNMVLAVGATPIFVDIDPATWCLDTKLIGEKIMPRTKAVIAVHLYGNVCDMQRLREITREHNLLLIEDTAHAAFSRYREDFAGTFGDVGCFSFQATKTIAMGEGGCVVTHNPEIFETMSRIRNHGMDPHHRYWHDVLGHNFRLTNLQAALGCAQLENVDRIVFEKQRIYERYRQSLNNERGIVFQKFPDDVDPVVWTTAIKINPDFFQGGRDFLIKSLAEQRIETRPGFYSFDKMPPYHAPALPVSDEVGRNVICLPSFPSLTDEQIEWICRQMGKLKK